MGQETMEGAGGKALAELCEYLALAMPREILQSEISHGELSLSVNASMLTRVMTFLRTDANCQFTQLMDVCGADYPERPKRFDVVYHLLSLRQNQRVRVKVQAGEGETVPTMTALYPSAGWFEREAWDMYGIYFDGHPDLRRILTDYGFDGHPLRKDFPLTGFVELRYDPAQQRVVYEPVKLPQAFRSFDFESPWEGMDRMLPGDEKSSI